jgi:16S rRNA (cytidine1402-2'-O)-methyltransferase
MMQIARSLPTSIRDTCGHVQVAVCRELTKVHEEIQRGSVDDVLAHYMTHTPRGEIVVVFHPTADAAT